MSYNVKPRQTYKPYRMHQMITASPALHESFRREWEANFDAALNRASALKEKGFLVEEGIGRGALMESQAKRIAKNLQEAGCEVELIPVAKWAGENVVFLVYKPPKEGETIHPLQFEKPKPKPRQPAQQTPDQLIQNFVKTFTYKSKYLTQAPDTSQMKDKGFMIDPRNLVALIDPNSLSSDSLIDMYRRARSAQSVTPIRIVNSPKLRASLVKAERVGKTSVTFDMAGKTAVAADNLRKALRVFRDGEPISIYIIAEERPVFVAREDGWAVAIAPIIEPSPSSTIHINEIIRAASQ